MYKLRERITKQTQSNKTNAMIDANTNTQTLPLSTPALSRPTEQKNNVAMSATHAPCLALYTASICVRIYVRGVTV